MDIRNINYDDHKDSDVVKPLPDDGVGKGAALLLLRHACKKKD